MIDWEFKGFAINSKTKSEEFFAVLQKLEGASFD